MLEEHIEVNVILVLPLSSNPASENDIACVTCAQFAVKCLWWGIVQLAMEIKLYFSVSALSLNIFN